MLEALFIARLILAAVFGVAGLSKLFDLPGSRKSMSEFGVPASLTRIAVVAVPLAELVCATALLIDPWAWMGAAGVTALLGIFIAGISVNLARGRKPSCRCFGQLSAAPVSWKTLVRNLALLTFALLIVARGRENAGTWPDAPSLTGFEALLISIVGALILGFAFLTWTLFHMLRQNGRLLIRLEAVEKKLKIDPNAPEIPGVPVGEPAPAFELANLDGEKIALASLAEPGKPLLLLFTEPTCGACEALHPDVARWQSEYADRLSIASISRGQIEANRRRAIESESKNVLLQTDREVWTDYLVTATPSAVLVFNGTIASPLAAGADEIRKLVARSTLPRAAKKGNPVPSMSFNDLEGTTVNLASFRGRRRLLLFWNPGCGFCQRMLDDVKRWERDRTREGPDLLVISGGSVEANRDQGFQSKVLLDPDWGVGTVLGATGTPSALLIDEDGKIASDVAVGAPAVLELAETGAKAKRLQE